MTAAQAALTEARQGFAKELGALETDFQQEIRRAEASWRGTWRARVEDWGREWQIERLLWQAAWLLLLVLALPYLIRLLFYFVLAPAAERRPLIRLRVPGGRGAPLVLRQPSATSVQIALAAGEELLVRQGFLQTSGVDGEKATRWLLDWRHPLSSLAAGLFFLTRLRGAGLEATVSAVHDPFAEVAELALPEGSACVLQPRALAAIVQPVARPLRITSHWRLFSLNAWLTMQLRYLVFHGPARLVLKGGRGVRVESAEQGRVFGQHQLVGFSAEVGYSVARTETFWPYFLGREPLLKDRVQRGDGVLILEETPIVGGGSGRVRHGLEGVADAMLKAVGL